VVASRLPIAFQFLSSVARRTNTPERAELRFRIAKAGGEAIVAGTPIALVLSPRKISQAIWPAGTVTRG
jgi:hypothetical protein